MPIDWAAPHSTEPARNTMMAARNTVLRPKMSPSFPAMAVMMVEASR